jgi:hypothetical protein
LAALAAALAAGFQLLQPLDLLEAQGEPSLALGLLVEPPQAAQLGATVHLLQASLQGLLLVAAQAQAVGLASLETLETVAMVGFTAEEAGVEALRLTTSATLVQAVQGRRAS